MIARTRTLVAAASLIAGTWVAVPTAQANSNPGRTVECRSIDYNYTECSAGGLRQPQLIHQVSSSPCILNNTWGYNPGSDRIWTAQGCAGVFADVGGYHHGSGDTYDPNARRYNDRGHDVGAVVGGVIVGALLQSMLKDKSNTYEHSYSNHSYDAYKSNDYRTSRKSKKGQYDGCHGLGCLVDNPDAYSAAPEPTYGQPTFTPYASGAPEPGQGEFRGPGE